MIFTPNALFFFKFIVFSYNMNISISVILYSYFAHNFLVLGSFDWIRKLN